jgi:hypothetical protein
MTAQIKNFRAYLASEALRSENGSVDQPIHTFGGRGSPFL